MNWLEQIVTQRAIQKSSLVLIETIDPERLDQLLNARLILVPKKHAADEEWDFTKKLIWDLQSGQVTDFEEKDVEGFDQMHIEDALNGMLHVEKQATLLVIKWAFNKEGCVALANWLIKWSQDHTIKGNLSTIIVLTNTMSNFDDTLQNWAIRIYIPASTEDERRKTLRFHYDEIREGIKNTTKPPPKAFDIPGTLDSMISLSRGLNLHDIRSVVYESYYVNKDITPQAITSYKTEIFKAYGMDYVDPTLNLSTVMGYEYLRDYIMRRFVNPIKNPKKYRDRGITPPKGILFYGMPGTGKTYWAERIAGECAIPMVKIVPADFFGSLVGQSEKNVRVITRRIEENAPMFVFLDEADQLLMNRETLNDSTDSGVSSRVISGILEWLGNDREGILIAATNHLEKIDRAFLRAGRIDKTVPLFNPDYESRLAMLKFHSRDKHVMAGTNYGSIAEATEMWSSSEIKELTIEAARIALDEGDEAVTEYHFKKAINSSSSVDTQQRIKQTSTMINIYKTHVPSYERWLLEMAQNANTKDKSLAEAFVQTVK